MKLDKFTRSFARTTQPVMLQLGDRHSYMLKKDGEIVIVDSCLSVIKQDKKEIYSISNRGFCDNYQRVIWPIKEDVLADFRGVEALVKGMISRHFNGERLNIYTTISPTSTSSEIKALSDSIEHINEVASVSMVFKPIAIALGIGLDIYLTEPIHIVEIHCDTRGNRTCSGRFHYGIELSTIAEGKLVNSEWLYAWEDDVVQNVLSKINATHPTLHIVGDCDDIYLYCRRFNESETCTAFVPDNPDCIALLGLTKMAIDERYKGYFTPKDTI